MNDWNERLLLLLESDDHPWLARLLCVCTGATLGLLWAGATTLQ